MTPSSVTQATTERRDRTTVTISLLSRQRPFHPCPLFPLRFIRAPHCRSRIPRGGLFVTPTPSEYIRVRTLSGGFFGASYVYPWLYPAYRAPYGKACPPSACAREHGGDSPCHGSGGHMESPSSTTAAASARLPSPSAPHRVVLLAPRLSSFFHGSLLDGEQKVPAFPVCFPCAQSTRSSCLQTQRQGRDCSKVH